MKKNVNQHEFNRNAIKKSRTQFNNEKQGSKPWFIFLLLQI